MYQHRKSLRKWELLGERMLHGIIIIFSITISAIIASGAALKCATVMGGRPYLWRLNYNIIGKLS